MKIVIDIPEEARNALFDIANNGKDIQMGLENTVIMAIVNGIPYEERPQGEWIKGKEISRTMLGPKVQHIEYKDYTCSNCGLVLDYLLYHFDGSPFYKFCPECGTEMRN